jgi:tetratricopeptide (TPR) repeat protein
MPDRKAPLEFRFTVDTLPDGQAVTAEEMERLILADIEDSGGTSKQALWNLATLYSRTSRHDDALDCIRKLTAMAEDSEERASCVLAMGQLQEQQDDFESAVRYYRSAFDLGPESTVTWYWINNNLGYSLIQIGKHEEAEGYLRAALTIDPSRPNAFKNLGLSLQGQEEHAQAAECFVLATQADASDNRSLKHLEGLVTENPEVLIALPDLQEKLEACRQAVREAASAQPDFHAHWMRLRERKVN